MEEKSIEKFLTNLFYLFVTFTVLLSLSLPIYSVAFSECSKNAHNTTHNTVEEHVEYLEEEQEVKTDVETVVEVTATAYCSCPKCCGEWANCRENGIVLTASGTVAKEGRTIAVDPSVIPLGTVVNIDGVEYIAEDTGSAIKGNRIDIYFESHEKALEFGKKNISIHITNEIVRLNEVNV